MVIDSARKHSSVSRPKIPYAIGQLRLQIILAQAPMSEVQKYVIDLKAMTQGRGKFTMTLDHYEEVPAKIAEKIIAERNA